MLPLKLLNKLCGSVISGLYEKVKYGACVDNSFKPGFSS